MPSIGSIALFSAAFAARGVSRCKAWRAPLTLVFAASCCTPQALAALRTVSAAQAAAAALIAFSGLAAALELVRRSHPNVLLAPQVLAEWALWGICMQRGAHESTLWLVPLLAAALLRVGWRFVEFARLVLSEH